MMDDGEHELTSKEIGNVNKCQIDPKPKQSTRDCSPN